MGVAKVTIDYTADGWRWSGTDDDGVTPIASTRPFPHQWAAQLDADHTVACVEYYDDKGQQLWKNVKQLLIHVRPAPEGAPIFDKATGHTVAAVARDHPHTPKLSQVLPVDHPDRVTISRAGEPVPQVQVTGGAAQ